MAEFEGISLDAAYELPIIQVLNGLAYLKAKAVYDTELNKRWQQ
ncbi:hypothetical protein [Mucilaginibacter pedocola]|nr:hypothetical protein [Mucilaginibacter pedocola]